MTDKPNIVLVHGAFADGSHWRHIIPRLYEAGHRLMAAQNPLTSLADDIATTRKLAEWMGGPTLLVGHSYGGAVITGAGRATNVVGLVYLAAFAPAQGESLNSILASSDPAPGLASISPAFDDDFLWRPPGHFRRRLLPGPRRHRVAGHGNKSEAARTSLLRRCHRGAGVEHQAKLVSGLGPRPNDPAADPAEDG
jgi:pimeloyl-ACP methyl ester carboxylesterase